MKGTVKHVSFIKGFAFITGDDHVQRFAHRSEFRDRAEFDLLREGRGVEFEHQDAPKGPRAVDMRLLQ